MRPIVSQAWGESDVSTDGRDVLVVQGDRLREVAEFVVLSAESVCRVMLLEVPQHRIRLRLDPAMVLLQAIIQVDIRPVTTLSL
jgi:hypothetical protein